MTRSPVAFIIFNRPETAAQVFAEIRRARPSVLLIVADGPRPNHTADPERCAQARAIVQNVDWPCDVRTTYAEHNLGCRRRVASGLDWVFQQVDRAIVLEDDCLPHPTFFRYCDELLERYADDARVVHVSGDNFQFGRRRGAHSYYFSRYVHVWGWASWQRAWRHYDVRMQRWAEMRQGGWLPRLLGDPVQVAQWKRRFDLAAQGRLDTWDYQWTFACWAQNGLSVLPQVNLVRNIGFNRQGTRTLVPHPWANLPTHPMRFPLSHPPDVRRDAQADRFTHWSQFSPRSLLARAANRMAGWRRPA